MYDLLSKSLEKTIKINKVGVTDLVLPVKIYDRKKRYQLVTAKINACVSLSENERGIHMSRIVKRLNDYSKKILSLKKIKKLLLELREEENSENSYLTMGFTMFKEKLSPITKHKSFVNYKCRIEGIQKGSESAVKLIVDVLTTSLCPISKSISRNSAHNQRASINVSVIPINDKIWFEDLIQIVEENGSCDLFGVLKREDEKFVTEKAYNNPKMVEDVVRDIAKILRKNRNIAEWSVSCKNFEAIHMHNVYAYIQLKNGR